MSAKHGNTVAAWVGVAIMMTAFVVGAIGLLIGSSTTFWASVGIFFVGPFAGSVLQKLGYGQAR
jgi:hypothetical protein